MSNCDRHSFITPKDSLYIDKTTTKDANGIDVDKWFYTGTFFYQNKRSPSFKLYQILINHPEHMHLVHIGLSMLSAVGGDFDEDDTVYADIYTIYCVRMVLEKGRYPAVVTQQLPHNPIQVDNVMYDHHFGPWGDDKNQGICSYVGPIQEEVTFRLFIYGDDCAGASFFIQEL